MIQYVLQCENDSKTDLSNYLLKRGHQMKRSLIAVITLLTVLPVVGGSKQNPAGLYPDIQQRIRTTVGEFDRIGEQRKE